MSFQMVTKSSGISSPWGKKIYKYFLHLSTNYHLGSHLMVRNVLIKLCLFFSNVGELSSSLFLEIHLTQGETSVIQRSVNIKSL